MREPTPDFADQLLIGRFSPTQISIGLAVRMLMFFAGLFFWASSSTAGTPEEHDLTLTRGYFKSLPPSVREHLCRLVHRLEPITQRHDTEGLVMGADGDQPLMMA